MTTIETSIRAVSFTKAQDAVKVFGGARVIKGITIHHWGSLGQKFASVVNFFENDEDESETSAHYVVGEGQIAQLVDDADVAWHAGNRTGNLTTIGIECRPEATEDDYALVVWLIKKLRAEHGDLPLMRHSDWKATNCPGVWDLDKLDKLARKKVETVTKFSSPLPLGTYRTSKFGSRVPAHLGTDWAGPYAGAKTPIYAVADGTVTAVGGPAANAVLNYHSGYIVVIDHGILTDKNGSDHIRTNYGHMSKILVKKGQKVKAGQQIGITGDTGNVTGVHLHFGVAQVVKGVWKYFDGEDWLKRKGITVGVTAPLTASTPAKAPATSKPTKKPSKPTQKAPEPVAGVKAALKKMGLPGTVAGVKKFQKAHGLVEDGVWGVKTQAKFDWNKKLQNALKAMKGVPKTWVTDGYIGKTSTKWKNYTLKRQGWTNANLVANLKKVKAW